MSVVRKNPRGANPRRPWTVRYWLDGRKKERSFTTRGEAVAFKADVDHAARYGSHIDGQAGRALFGQLAATWLERQPLAPASARTYGTILHAHIQPVLGGRTLAAVAADRDRVADILAVRMKELSISRRRAARRIITGVLDEAVRAGKLASHRCGDIPLAGRGPGNSHSDFVFPAYSQVCAVAKRAGICVWLMRGCGLRIQEALAVGKEDFRENGTVLRVSGQASRSSREKVPLKHRQPGQYRDVPVPTWLWEMVRDLPDGPLMPGTGPRRYASYTKVHPRFMTAAARAGIPGSFTPHSLRHCFASTLLASGVPITDVAAWLGHVSINTTYAIYGHLVPSAAGRAVAALDGEFAAWSRAGLTE